MISSPTQRMGVEVEEVEGEQKDVEERGAELAISFVSSAQNAIWERD